MVHEKKSLKTNHRNKLYGPGKTGHQKPKVNITIYGKKWNDFPVRYFPYLLLINMTGVTSNKMRQGKEVNSI
jgi:hypothetical protein